MSTAAGSPVPALELDRTTLDDLEWVAAADGSEGVLRALVRCETRLGIAALAAHLRQPPRDASAIREVQRAVVAIQDDPAPYVALLRAADPDAVAAYHGSRYATLARGGWGGTAEAAWVALRHRDLLRHAREGFAVTVKLLRAVLRDGGALLERRPPAAVAAVLDPLVETARALLAWTGSAERPLAPIPVLLADRRLRADPGAPLARCLDRLARLDALMAMARITAERGWTMPEVEEDAEQAALEFEGLRHVWLPQGTANDASLGAGGRVALLTGPNMSGKTTLMKATGLAVVLAHAGMGVPARRMRWTPFDALITDMRPPDGVRLGVSGFLAEVRRVRHAMTALIEGRRVLLLLDELFRSTAPDDAGEAVTRILGALGACPGAVTMASIHLPEVADRLARVSGLQVMGFDARLEGGALRFDHRLRPGAHVSRLALPLLEREGVLELLRRLPGSRN